MGDLQDIVKSGSIHITGVPEGEEREQGIGKIFEKIVTGNLPNQANEMNIWVQEAEGGPKQDGSHQGTL